MKHRTLAARCVKIAKPIFEVTIIENYFESMRMNCKIVEIAIKLIVFKLINHETTKNPYSNLKLMLHHFIA